MLVISSCTSYAQEAKDITVEELQKVLQTSKGLQLVDVRTPEEWKGGSIVGATKINFYDENFETIALEKLDKRAPVYIFCKSGGRSKQAADLLQKKGYQTYNIVGGYTKWEQNNK